MSYDMHGSWDIDNKWVGPWLNAHSNLTEIKDAMDLLWRNGIDSSKVVMGLAFYGRGTTLTNPGCSTPGCRYASAAGKQPCSREAGILLNSEIMDIISNTGAVPTLYPDAAVKTITWGGDQWVSFDDEETLALKAIFAQSKCLGGVMVWAVSHDTPNARFSRALGNVAPRKFNPMAVTNPQSQMVKSFDQCKWTNCGEGKSHPFSEPPRATSCSSRQGLTPINRMPERLLAHPTRRSLDQARRVDDR